MRIAQLIEAGHGVHEHFLRQLQGFIGVAQPGQGHRVHGRVEAVHQLAERLAVAVLGTGDQYDNFVPAHD